MKKPISLIVLLLCAAARLAAQNTGSVTGTLVDAADGEPIVGAVVALTTTSDGTAGKHTVSDTDGRFGFKSLPAGKYALSATYLGYAELKREITVGTGAVALGSMKMSEEAQNIEGVVLEVQAMRTSQKGDTVVYNAGAFKVARDADAEGLLSKMPGITITDGAVEAQGEEVKKVFVDGKEFFGEDVSTAIKNIPAEMVDKVEVYNKLSDQAEFTGMDDGEGYKAINIVTSLDKRSGQFGKLYGAYGIKDKYIIGGNVNIFSGDSRVSLIALFNNLNQQNFSFEDILGVVSTGGVSSGGGRMHMGRGAGSFMVRPQSGVASVQAMGVNYSDTWGKKFEVQASYFFNRSNTLNEETIDRQTFTASDTIQYLNSYADSRTINLNHRFNARLEWKIDDNNTVLIRPRVSWQANNTFGELWSTTERGLENERTFLKDQKSLTDRKRHGINSGINILYRAKLGKPGRTLTVNLSGTYGSNNQKSLPEQYIYYTPYTDGQAADSTYNQRIVNISESWSADAGATYTEPLSKSSQISLEYRASYDYSDADRKTYLWALQPGGIWGFNPDFDEELSNIYNSGYLTQRAGPGYRYSKGTANISVSAMYQNSTLTGTQTMPERPEVSRSFDNIVYRAMANFNFDRQNSLRVFARSYTRNPSVTQLQDVVDFSDPQYVSAGNPALKPTYNNMIMAHYINSNITKGRTFMLMAGFESASNYIADAIVIDRPDYTIPGTSDKLGIGNQFTRPVNLNGYWSLRAGVSYGFPLNFMKSNFNVNLGVMLNEMPSIINEQKSYMRGMYYNGGVQIGSNISENIDFTVSWNGSYNISQNSDGRGGKTDNEYFNQYLSADFKWVAWKGITLTASAAYSQYKGITNDFNEQYLICNIYIGKKLFRNQLGEISVGVNDLLDQNRSFRRTVQSTYIQNTTNNAIGRYVAVQFIYNLRVFGKKASRDSKLYDNLDKQGESSGVGIQRSENRRFPGPPPGGRPH